MRRPRFDPVVLAPTRLTILALLSATDQADFKFIRDNAGLSDSTLSKQLVVLEDAGLIDMRKVFVGKRPRTWISLSAAGRRTFETHVAALNEILGNVSKSRKAG